MQAEGVAVEGSGVLGLGGCYEGDEVSVFECHFERLILRTACGESMRQWWNRA